MIAQASHDENNKYIGGRAGDQTEKEVLVRGWYSRPWNYRIRLKDRGMRERFACAMERAAENDMIGYDQNTRNTLAMKAGKVGWDPGFVTEPCNCDCSSLVVVALIYAGIPKEKLYNGNNAATTRDLRKKLMPYADVSSDPADLESEEGALRGDIWLYEGHHVAVELDDHVIKEEKTIPGIDVSEFQGVIDWEKVAAAGIKYVVLRAITKEGVDKQFERNYQNARAAGLKVGVYAFCYDKTKAQAKSRAKRLLEVLGARSLELPVFYDLEWTAMERMAKETITEIAIAFSEEIRTNSNYRVGLYMNMHWYKNCIIPDEVSGYDLWIASQKSVKPVEGIAGQQYSWAGRIDGIRGKVDLDRWYKSYEEEKKIIPGWHKIGEKWKYMKPDGTFMKSSWIEHKSFWYYVGEDGYMLTGPQIVDGECYFFCMVKGSYEGAMMRTNARGALTLTPNSLKNP